MVYTKTIIHLSVGESGGYLPRRFAARQISTTIHLHFGEQLLLIMAEYPWWAFDVMGELSHSLYNVQYTHEEKILLWVWGPR